MKNKGTFDIGYSYTTWVVDEEDCYTIEDRLNITKRSENEFSKCLRLIHLYSKYKNAYRVHLCTSSIGRYETDSIVDAVLILAELKKEFDDLKRYLFEGIEELEVE